MVNGSVGLVRKGVVGWLVFDRPAARNALTMSMREEAMAHVGGLLADEDVRVIGVTGAGDTFCGGGDIDSMTELSDSWAGRSRTTTAQDLALSLYQAEKPTIAVARGSVAGLGVSVFAACDIRLAAPDTTFRAGFPGVGLMPDAGLLYLLPRLVGWGRTRDWALTGSPISADVAAAWGLVSEIGDDPADIIERLASFSPKAIALTKAGLRVAADGALAALLEYERTAQGLLIDTEESRARIAQFLGNRPK